MSYFPVFVQLQDAPCLVVGGGKVAWRKAKQLQEFGGNITVVSPDVCPCFEKMIKENPEIEVIYRKVIPQDMEGKKIVIGATNESFTNEKIADWCAAKNILVNIVDEPSLCSFFVPSIVKKQELVIGVSSGGKAPVLAAWIGRKIREIIPDAYGDLNEELGRYRKFLKEKIPVYTKRKHVYEKLIHHVLCENKEISEDFIIQEMKREEDGNGEENH